MLGRKITTLMDQYVTGEAVNTVTFKPNDEVSGIYIYKYIVDGNAQVGKLIYKNE